MPFLEPVEETYWCPGPWPWEWFDTCTRTRHRWCYSFDYYRSEARGVWRTVTACEGGRQYSWSEFGLHFRSFEVSDTGGVGSGPYKECFSERKAQRGGCTENLATGSSRLTPSNEPFIGRTTVELTELSRETVERGAATFTPENSHRCRQGNWPWQRIRHSQQITIAAHFGHVDVAWTLNGFALSGAGKQTIPVFSSWPSPAPAKKSSSTGTSSSAFVVVQHAVLPNLVSISYTIDNTAPGSSILRLLNPPSAGNFDLEVGFAATVQGARYYNETIDCHFSGETITFDVHLLAQEARCVFERHHVDRGPPRPGGPVIDIDYVRQAVPEARQEMVSNMLAIMEGVLGRDAEASAMLLDRLGEELGPTGALRALGGHVHTPLRKRPPRRCNCHAK